MIEIESPRWGFDEYQRAATRTFNANLSAREQLSLSTLGLAGEAAEVMRLVTEALGLEGPTSTILFLACLQNLQTQTGRVTERIKKNLFHRTPMSQEELAGELGDVLWYLSQLGRISGLSLQQIARGNIAKLLVRRPPAEDQEVPRLPKAEPLPLQALLIEARERSDQYGVGAGNTERALGVMVANARRDAEQARGEVEQQKQAARLLQQQIQHLQDEVRGATLQSDRIPRGRAQECFRIRAARATRGASVTKAATYEEVERRLRQIARERGGDLTGVSLQFRAPTNGPGAWKPVGMLPIVVAYAEGLRKPKKRTA